MNKKWKVTFEHKGLINVFECYAKREFEKIKKRIFSVDVPKNPGCKVKIEEI